MIAHVDISTGASGDKLVGALLQACESLGVMTHQEFCETFESMLPEVEVEVQSRTSNGVAGLGLHVDFKPGHASAYVHEHSEQHTHTHEHTHEHTHAEHSHAHEHTHEHVHEHRSWEEIKQMLQNWNASAQLTPSAYKRAVHAFELIAQAEAKAHNVPIEQVHFHEVGAIDSIVDIVGASILLDKLDITKLYSTPITVGFGTVKCAHGTLPVPAPATANLCCDLPVVTGPYEGEMTTPTGAALLKANVTNWSPMPTMVPRATGMGLGTRTLKCAANCLRIIVGEGVSAATEQPTGAELNLEGCVLLQSNIDHLSPEILASCCEDLMSLGALDVWQQPILMKKGRMACLLNVLVRTDDCDCICQSISQLTGTLGVRRTQVERAVAPRSVATIDTQFGEVSFKIMKANASGEVTCWVRPEHEDVARIAREHGLAYEQVFEQLVQAYKQR